MKIRNPKLFREMYLRWLQAKRDLPHLDHSGQEPELYLTKSIRWTDREAKLKQAITRDFNRRF